MMTQIKTDTEIAAMRESGQMLATVLQLLKTKVEPGVSTKQLADLAKQELRSLGGVPAFLGYQGYPDVLCTSVNEAVVHGIPSTKQILQTGDIIGLDFGVRYRGMITDAAISVVVDKGKPRLEALLKNTEKSLQAGINVVKNGVHIGDIGAAVQAVLDKQNYGIVRDLVGHGVGHQLHEDPNIPNYGRAGRGPILRTGMTVAIEPMATLGDYKVKIEKDGWTITTADNSLAAHFEHTILVTEDGAEILTQLS